MKTQFQSHTSTPKPIRPEEVVRKTEAGILQLDADRADGYAGLLALRSAKARALTVRAKLYAAKYGGESPLAARAELALKQNALLRQELTVAYATAVTPVPEVDDSTYVLHGFVRNAERKPISGLTVALYDQKGQWLRADEFNPTDENGHYALRFGEAPSEKRTTKPDKRAAEKAKQEALASGLNWDASAHDQYTQQSTKTPSGSQQEAKRAYEIRVYDSKQKLIHREAKPVHPRLGVIEYREITIADGSHSTGYPPVGKEEHPSPPPAPKPAKGTAPKPAQVELVKAAKTTAKPAARSARMAATKKKKKK